jgi:hypothetical protein
MAVWVKRKYISLTQDTTLTKRFLLTKWRFQKIAKRNSGATTSRFTNNKQTSLGVSPIGAAKGLYGYK